MTLDVDILAPAQRDANDAQDWYDEVSPGLGDAFTDEFLATLVALAEMPNIGSHRFTYLYPHIDLRVWSLDRFPFRIFYAVHGDTLRIYRVLHERRNVTRALLHGVK